ncbi:MAG TPA: DUF1570 domain-containing protein [Planctomycetota bacterium]|nr:DUF1570 domain-containing protein [Planctomycetota bacterium]
MKLLHDRSGTRIALAASLGWLLALPLAADTLVTKDGRVIEVKKTSEDSGGYHLIFEAGEIVVPKDHVASVEIEGDMADYVPKDDKERELLAKGFVRLKGKWISKPQYESELAAASAARRARTAELVRRSDFANGWKVESKHFLFQSNTSAEILQRYVDLLESYYALMDTRIGIKPTPTLARTKMAVNVYRRQKEMIVAAGGDEQIDESVLGYFDSSGQTLNFFHDYKDPDRSIQTALHECTHLLTYLIDPDYLSQIWINEATAEFFGSCEVTIAKGKVTLVPGRVLEDAILTVQQMLGEKKQVALSKVLAAEDEEFDGLYYAHAWSFVYFLQNTPKYAKPFNKFFKDLYGLDLKEEKAELLDAGSGDRSGLRRRYTKEAIRDTLLKRLGVKDVDALEKEWLAFVAAVPLPGTHARFLRGYNRTLYEGDAKGGLADLDAAIDAGFKDPEAFWARGYARLGSGQREKALEDFKRAVELAPLDAVYRADVAWCLTGWWGKDSEKIHGSEEDIAEAAKQLGLAAALDPENDELQTLYDEFVEARKAK